MVNMFATLAFQRFKEQNISNAMRLVEMEECVSSSELARKVQRLAKIHLMIRKMYCELREDEREAYGQRDDSVMARCANPRA